MSTLQLEECVKRLEDSYKKNNGVIQAEAHAIETLNSRKDILEFRKKYIGILKNNLLKGYENSKHKTGFYKLIEKKYNIEDIAALKFNDSILFTLGHMSTNTIDNWYNYLPYVSRSTLPKMNEMYRIVYGRAD
jgi:hypothetical protein